MTVDINTPLPVWKRPITLLVLMAFAMPLAFSAWLALLNNFVHDVAGFTGRELGWLHSVREIPGFFAVGVIVVLWFMREQLLAYVTLILLGAGVAVTAYFPSFGGLLITTFVGSLGFHYYETVKQSLELQWIKKEDAPVILGRIVAVSSAGSLIAYGAIMVAWKTFQLDFNTLYLASGGLLVVIAVYCWAVFPTFTTEVTQNKGFVMRRRYWLYYTLQFMAGARRQIFMVFAAYMMIERFDFQVHEVTALFLINYIANIIFAPIMGSVVKKYGERNALIFEYIGLTLVFAAYAGIYIFGWGVVLAATLYVVDHLFFALAFAQKTYFQKIADAEDIAPTAAVAFTINHIGAVVLPALLGYVWIVSPSAVFWIATIMSLGSLMLATFIPRFPVKGRETVFNTSN